MIIRNPYQKYIDIFSDERVLKGESVLVLTSTSCYAEPSDIIPLEDLLFLKKAVLSTIKLLKNEKQLQLYTQIQEDIYEQSKIDWEISNQRSREGYVAKIPDTFIYLIKDTFRDIYKIGITKDMKTRLRTIKNSNGNVELIATFKGRKQDEDFLHEHFNHKSLNNEWFQLSDEDVAYFKAVQDKY